MLVTAALSLLLVTPQTPATTPTAPRPSVEYATYYVADVLQISGATKVREVELLATREYAERAWRWLGLPTSFDAQVNGTEPAVCNAAAPGVIALAASASRHEQFTAFLALQREEDRQHTFVLTVYECDLAAAEAIDLKQPGARALVDSPAEGETDSVVQQLQRTSSNSLEVLSCPKLLTRGPGRATISASEEHEFLVSAHEKEGRLVERHQTIREGLAVEASAVKLAGGYWGIDLATEVARLEQPVRTELSPLTRGDGTAVVLSHPETRTVRSRVSLKMKPGTTLLWRTAPEAEAPATSRCTLVSLRFELN